MSIEGQLSNEATNSSKITNILLNDRNFLSWSRSARLALSGRELLEFITGEIKKPEPATKDKPSDSEKLEIRQWQTKNDRVMTWLMASMEPGIADLFMSADTAKDLWEGVQNHFGQQNNFSHVYRLRQEIQKEQQGTRSNTEYLGALKRKKDELQCYRPPTTDPQLIQKRIEEDDIFYYLSGLNPSYEAVRSQLLLTTVLPSYASITQMIQQEESRRLAMGGPQATNGEGHETHGFAVKNPSFSQNPSFQKSQNRSNSNERCTHCKREGPNQDRCWFLHPHLKLKKFKMAENGEGRGGDREEERRKWEKEGEKRGFYACPSQEKKIGSGSGYVLTGPTPSPIPGPNQAGHNMGIGASAGGFNNGSGYALNCSGTGGSKSGCGGSEDQVTLSLQQLSVLLGKNAPNLWTGKPARRLMKGFLKMDTIFCNLNNYFVLPRNPLILIYGIGDLGIHPIKF